MTVVEAIACAINAEAWEPPPGMVKRRCNDCRYWFATADVEASQCPDCAGYRGAPALPLAAPRSLARPET